jgi:hypothetical protein
MEKKKFTFEPAPIESLSWLVAFPLKISPGLGFFNTIRNG